MSDSVNVPAERPCGVSSSRGQDRPGGVSVSSGDVSTGRALESSLRQRQAVLGSRPALAAHHRCVGGRHDHLMRGDDLTSPLAGCLLALAGYPLVCNGSLALCLPIAARRFLVGFGFTSGHAALIFRELRCGGFRVLGRFEVELRLRRGGDCGYAPIDTHRAVDLGKWLLVDAYDKAGVPVAEAVPVDAHRARFGRQLPRPHDRDQPAASQPRQRRTGRGQVLAADMRVAILARRSICQALIPNPTGSVPLAHQRTLGLRSRAQPIVETQHR